jgi:hypothetical protein
LQKASSTLAESLARQARLNTNYSLDNTTTAKSLAIKCTSAGRRRDARDALKTATTTRAAAK